MSDRRSEEDRRTGGRAEYVYGLIERVKVYAVIGTLVSLVFAGGYNWRGVRDLEGQLVTIRGEVRALDERSVNKDVLAAEFRALSVEIVALRRELEQLREGFKPWVRER